MNAQHIKKLMTDAKRAEIRERNANIELERTRAILKAKVDANESQAQRIAELESELALAVNRPVAAEEEVKRLHRQVRYLKGEVGNASRVAVLDITRDALGCMGETMQQIQTGKPMSDVKAGLNLSILALGAKTTEKVGSVIDYDSKYHKSIAGLPSTGKVKVIASGLNFTRGLKNNPIRIIKAIVKPV